MPGPRSQEPPPADAVVEKSLDQLATENERLREQVKLLQTESEARDAEDAAVPEYEHAAAGTGHLEDRLARVTGAMSRIPKRGFNDHQKYPFVTHGDVVDAVRPALAAEGVRFKSELVKMEQTQAMLTSGQPRATSSLPWTNWECTIDYTFSCRVGDEVEEDKTRWVGYAEDFGDKGGSKAMTATLKTFLIQTFLLSAGDDPDIPTEGGAQRAQPAQRAQGGGGGQAQRPNVSGDVRAARNACLDHNQNLPQGKLGQIAKKITGQAVVMKIEDVAQLNRIAKAAERYVANPEGGESWLAGEAAAPADPQERSGEPDPAEEEARQEAATAPDVPAVPVQAYDAKAAGDYDPPLTEEEARQHALGLNPRPLADADDDTPF